MTDAAKPASREHTAPRVVPLKRGARVPVWRQIETDIGVAIQNGLYSPGERLPSEHELTATYGVNRHTVRMALAELAERGLVVTHQGRGAFVAEAPFDYPITRDSKWSEVERQLEVSPRGRLLSTTERPATARLSALLAVPEGAPLTVTESVREASGGVATYGYHLFSATRFPRLAQDFAEGGSFTTAFAAAGVDAFYRKSTWIDARLPRPVEADALRVSIDVPVLVMTYVDCDASGAPLLYGHGVFPTGRMRLRVDSI